MWKVYAIYQLVWKAAIAITLFTIILIIAIYFILDIIAILDMGRGKSKSDNTVINKH